MLKKNYKILSLFAKQTWKRFTFKEIKALSKSKSESYVYNTLKQFLKEEIIVSEKAGNVVLYSANKTRKAIINLAMASEHDAWKQKHLPYKDIEGVIAKISGSFFSFIVTGSFAEGKQKKGSDLDVVILCDNKAEPKAIYSELRHFCEMNIPPIHLYVFKEDEFLKMLLDSKPNYGKEIAKNNLVICGAENYLSIVLEAVKNGFHG